MVITLGEKDYTAQVKPFSTISIVGDKVELHDTGNVKPYSVDWLIFSNPKTNKILIFRNNPISDKNQYVFDMDSLLHEIE